MRTEIYPYLVYIVYCFGFLFEYHHCETDIIVNSTKIKHGCRESHPQIICSSLDSLFNSKLSLNNARVIIEDTEITLNNHYSINNVENLIILAASEVTVTCNANNSAGLLFTGASNIQIGTDTGYITFQHCGRTVEIITDEKMEIESTLCFNNINNLVVKNIQCLRYNGYGIVLINIAGNFNMEHINLTENNPSKVYGGGLLILCQKEKTISKQYFNFKKLTITKLLASNKTCRDFNSSTPFGNGGAISMYFNKHSTNYILTFNDTFLSQNLAQFGGSIYIYDNKEANTFIFNNLTIHNSTAVINGGGIFYFTSTVTNALSTEIDVFHCNSCTLSSCSALVAGGGLSIFRSNLTTRGDKRFRITNSIFSMNKGNGSDMFLSKVSLELTDINNFSGLHMSENGKIAMERSHLNISGSTTVSNSTSSGIVAEHSNLYIDGTLNLLSNKGKNGGGLAMYGPSIIHLGNNCTFNVINNSAQSKGNGIYAKIATSEYLQKCDCLFQFEGSYDSFNGTVSFRENSENDIYVSSVHNCRHNDNEKAIVNWPNFNFTSLHPVTTDPVHIKLDNKEWAGLTYPGIFFNVKIKLLDEFKIPSSGIVLIRSNSNSTKDLSFVRDSYYIAPSSKAVSIKIQGVIGKSYAISFFISSIHSNTVSLVLNHCPYLLKMTNYCVCPNTKSLKKKGSVVCENQKIFLLENLWTPEALPGFKYLPYENQTVISCPYSYCKICRRSQCLYNKSQQCANGRNQTSRLCSQCKTGFSLSMKGNQKCVPCNPNLNPYSAAVIVALSMALIRLSITGVIIAVNSEVLAGFISLVPFLYFYMFLPDFLFGFKDWNSDESNSNIFITWILGARDFPLFLFPNCFVKDLNNMNIQFIYLFAAMSWAFNLWLCYILFHKKFRVVKQETCKRSIIAIGFVLYSELLEFVIRILKRVEILGKCYAYYYAKEDCIPTSAPHVLLFIFAIVSLALMVIFFVVIFLTTTWSAVKIIEQNGDKGDGEEDVRFLKQGLHKVIQKMANWRYFLWCKPAIISLQYGFKSNKKEDYTWFSLVYILFVTFFKSLALTLNKMSVHTTFLTTCVLSYFLIFVSIMPYTSSFSNLFESCLLGLLIFAGILTDSNNGTYMNSSKTYKYFIVSICVAPLLLIVLLSVYFTVSRFTGRSIRSCFKRPNTGVKEPLLPKTLIKKYKEM